MDDSCALGSLASFTEGPCSVFILSCSEEGSETKGMVGGTDQMVEAAFLQADSIQKLSLLLFSVQSGDFAFNLSADHNYR